MKKIEVIMATSHVDRQGEKFDPRGLIDAATQLKEKYLPFIINHDIRFPPIGRVHSAKIIKLKDGEYALKGIVEVFEPSDSLETLKGDGRRIPIKNKEIKTISVEYDRSFSDEIGNQVILDLSFISGPDDKPREYAKKSFEPISLLIVSAGIFIIGSIAKGFFSKLGSDAYESLKSALRKYYRKNKLNEKVFDLCFILKDINNFCEAHVLVVNPSEENIERLFNSRFNGIDDLVISFPIRELDIAKIVFEYKEDNLIMRYAVRSDGVPLSFKIEKD